MNLTRVVLADDHALFRESLAHLLEAAPGFSVVGQAKDANEAVHYCCMERPDVAVVDLSMRGNGISAIERVTRACPETRCLALTMHDDPVHLGAVLAAGGAGYLVKGATADEFMVAIRSVAGGRAYIRVSVGTEGLRGVTSGPRTPAPPSILSARERDILRGVAQGFSSREIAERMGLKPKTIEAHRARLRTKLGLHGRAAFVDYAVRAGLLNLD